MIAFFAQIVCICFWRESWTELYRFVCSKNSKYLLLTKRGAKSIFFSERIYANCQFVKFKSGGIIFRTIARVCSISLIQGGMDTLFIRKVEQLILTLSLGNVQVKTFVPLNVAADKGDASLPCKIN